MYSPHFTFLLLSYLYLKMSNFRNIELKEINYHTIVNWPHTRSSINFCLLICKFYNIHPAHFIKSDNNNIYQKKEKFSLSCNHVDYIIPVPLTLINLIIIISITNWFWIYFRNIFFLNLKIHFVGCYIFRISKLE